MNVFGDHHRRSIRLKGYDYSRDGAYFVTICAQNRGPVFGSVKNGKMVLNNLGKTAEMYWCAIPFHYPHAILDLFVVMPNHVHGVVVIDNDVRVSPVGANNYSPLRTHSHLQPIPDGARPRGTSKTIGAVIRGYKIGVTKWARNNLKMRDVWQRNYYENIIRDDRSLNRIREYICNNPAKWESDRNNPDRAIQRK